MAGFVSKYSYGTTKKSKVKRKTVDGMSKTSNTTGTDNTYAAPKRKRRRTGDNWIG